MEHVKVVHGHAARRTEPRPLAQTLVSLATMVQSSVLVPGLIGLLLASIVVSGRLISSGGDPSTFVRAAPPVADPLAVPPTLHLGAPSELFDGVYFYRFAIDPWAQRDVGIRLDYPAFRHQRVLYPLLVWGLSAGQTEWVPWLLVAVNALGLGVLGLLGGMYARAHHRPAWWGAALPLYLGFTFTLARDLSEIVQSCCLVGVLLALDRGRPIWAASLLALAVLARETAVLMALVLLADGIFGLLTRRQGVPWYVGAAGLTSYALVQAAVWLRWGVVPLVAGMGTGDLGTPLAAPIRYLGVVGHLGQAELGFVVGLVLLGLVSRHGPRHLRLCLAAYVCLLATLSYSIWRGDASWLRAATEASLLAWFLVLQAGTRQVLLALGGAAALWPAVARWAITT